MADVQVSLSLCADHCLHSGSGSAGQAQCCWCGVFFSIPTPTVTYTGPNVLGFDAQTGPFWPAILTAGGKLAA